MRKFYRRLAIPLLAIGGAIMASNNATAQKLAIQDEGLRQAADTWRAQLLEAGCNGCQDFQVACMRDMQVSRADQLNGVAERKLVGVTYVLRSQSQGKYLDSSRMVQFAKKKNVWTYEGMVCPGWGGEDMKKCKPPVC